MIIDHRYHFQEVLDQHLSETYPKSTIIYSKLKQQISGKILHFVEKKFLILFK